MTEYNMFCYSKKYNDENSFNQKTYRVFNVEVGEERYDEIKYNLPKFTLKLKEKDWKDAWREVWENKELRDYITSLPEFTWEFWEKFSGIQNDTKKKVTLELKDEQIKKIESIIK